MKSRETNSVHERLIERNGQGDRAGGVTRRNSVELAVAPIIASHDINGDGYKQHS